jgi:hypothetical protein
MLYSFLVLAARSSTRQRSFRSLAAAHLGLLLAAVWAAAGQPGRQPFPTLGHLLLCAGIVEGALLVGWRLTQMPKSQALEFLLVSPLRPHRFFLYEAAVGAAWLALITLAGLPILLLLVFEGRLQPWDVPPLLIMPFSWGLLTGLGLAAYAYEPLWLRRVGELVALIMVLLYLVVGILAGELLPHWLDLLPAQVKSIVLDGLYGFHLYNPFMILHLWITEGVGIALDRALYLQAAVLIVLLLWLLRAAFRLQGHFRERHYQPIKDVSQEMRPSVGNRPLSWWAVKRVAEYSGRINLYLAGGFGLLYAAYTVAGPYWPAWLGKRVFELCDGAGGIAGISTGLVLLSAVPAAFQYGLWDSNVPDRCRRLELLLLTGLQPGDYWHAAAMAAWSRGRGYFAVALLLWTAAALAGMIPLWQVGMAIGTGLLLWAFYFTLGFRAFVRGAQANGLGMLLTVGLPLLVFALDRLQLPYLGRLLPPGLVFGASQGLEQGGNPLLPLLASALLLVSATVIIARRALNHCDRDLRRWYDLNQGQKALT